MSIVVLLFVGMGQIPCLSILRRLELRGTTSGPDSDADILDLELSLQWRETLGNMIVNEYICFVGGI